MERENKRAKDDGEEEEVDQKQEEENQEGKKEETNAEPMATEQQAEAWHENTSVANLPLTNLLNHPSFRLDL